MIYSVSAYSIERFNAFCLLFGFLPDGRFFDLICSDEALPFFVLPLTSPVYNEIRSDFNARLICGNSQLIGGKEFSVEFSMIFMRYLDMKAVITSDIVK